MRILLGGNAGLWDRIKALVCVVAFAELTFREVHVRWNDPAYSDDGDDVFFKYFQSDRLTPWPDDLTITGVYPEPWEGNLDKTIMQLRKSLRSAGKGDQLGHLQLDVSAYRGDAQVLVAYNGPANKTEMMARLQELAAEKFGENAHLVRPSIASGDWLGLVSEITAAYLSPSPTIRAAVQEFRRAQFGEETIGLQVRYTDRIIDLSRMFLAVDRLRAERPDARIFLATDSAPVQQMIKTRYQNVATREIRRSDERAPLHRGNATGGAFQGGFDALVDLYLLASCDYLLYCANGFSEFAAATAPIPESRKITYHPPGASMHTAVRLHPKADAPAVSLLVPADGELPQDFLTHLRQQLYPPEGLDLVVFGTGLEGLEGDLSAAWPGGRLIPTPDSSPLPAIQAARNKVTLILDSHKRRHKNWVRLQVHDLLKTPLCGLLYSRNGREVAFLTTLIRDPGLHDEPLHLSPDSAWGTTATALGYTHRPMRDRPVPQLPPIDSQR